MTSAARDLRYGRGYPAVDGSLAYDLDWAVRERELRHAGEATRPAEKTRQEPKVRSVEQVQVRQRQHVSLLSVTGAGVVIVMMVMILMGYIQLTVLSSDTVALKEQLSALETENVTLTAQYERMFDMATVKEVASAAGMSKPGSSQIYYLDLSGEDSAVVYQQEDPSLLGQLLAQLHHGVYAVVEYFN